MTTKNNVYNYELTKRIEIPNGGGPNLPKMGYYNKNTPLDDKLGNPNNYSYPTLQYNLNQSCTRTNGYDTKTKETAKINDVKGIYDPDSSDPDDKKVLSYIPPNTASLDIPYYLAMSGLLMLPNPNNQRPELPKNLTQQIISKVNTICQKKGARKDSVIQDDVQTIINQIQYPTCQLTKERNRYYDPSTFNMFTNTPSLKDIFNTYSSLKPFLVFIFSMTIYLLLSGLFGSMDMVTNIFNIISNNKLTIWYWGGLLLGIIIPVIILIVVYANIIKKFRNFEKYDITNNPYGVKNDITKNDQNIDYMTLVLYIFLLYALIAVLFTIKKSFFGLYINNLLIIIVLTIITIFLYIFYSYLPFLNLTNEKGISSNQPLKLYISEQETESKIKTNKDEVKDMQYAFMVTFIIMFILTIIYFVVNTQSQLFSGLLSTSAILFIPLIWIFNIIIAINYFYYYPVILIVVRFIRYIIMAILYIITEKYSVIKDNFSEDLVEQLNNFKDYTPTWGLIGIDEIKLFLNTMGYKNEFSSSIIPNNEVGKNVSQNKFISSGFLNYIVMSFIGKDKNIKGIIYGIVLFFLTIIVSAIVLASINQI